MEKKYIFQINNKIKSPSGIVLIVHGFGEHCGRYEEIAQFLTENNFSVYRFDLSGHGNSGPNLGAVQSLESLISDIDEMINNIKLDYPDNNNIFILGHSMGAFLSLIYGALNVHRVKGYILSGVAVDTLKNRYMKLAIKTLDKIAPELRVKTNLSKKICSDKKVFIKYKNDPLVFDNPKVHFIYEVFVKGNHIMHNNIFNFNDPVLICHGKNDTVVSPDAAEFVYKNIISSDKNIIYYYNSFHEILNDVEKSKVFSDVSNWLQNRIIY